MVIYSKNRVGHIGEEAVVKFLQGRGYEILDKNYDYKYGTGIKRGEIDIIAKKDDTIHFVEVKTLTEQNDFFPEDKINWQKQKRLLRAAQIWLSRQGPEDGSWQIDAAAVILDLKNKKAKIRYFHDIAKM